MLLNEKKYNAKIKIYYKDNDLNDELTQEILNYVWLNEDIQQSNDKFELIQDTKANVYKLKFNNRIYYVKSYRFRNLSKIVKNLFRPVEAVRYFETAMKLMHADIAIAKPVLALTFRKNLFLVDSIFVLEEAPGADLSTYLSKFATKEARKEIVKKVALIWSKLVKNKFLHLDPRLVNFIVYDGLTDLHIDLIDLDSISVLPFLPFNILLRKNLIRLKNRLLKDFSTTEINLFFAEFIKNGDTKLTINMLQKICNISSLPQKSQFYAKDI